MSKSVRRKHVTVTYPYETIIFYAESAIPVAGWFMIHNGWRPLPHLDEPTELQGTTFIPPSINIAIQVRERIMDVQQ